MRHYLQHDMSAYKDLDLDSQPSEDSANGGGGGGNDDNAGSADPGAEQVNSETSKQGDSATAQE